MQLRAPIVLIYDQMMWGLQFQKVKLERILVTLVSTWSSNRERGPIATDFKAVNFTIDFRNWKIIIIILILIFMIMHIFYEPWHT